MLEGKDQFERWIDEGVRRYLAAEPPLGMEARVLAEVEHRQKRRDWWRPWMIAVPVAAVLAIGIGLSLQEKTRPQPVAPQVSKTVPASPAQPTPEPQMATQLPKSHTRVTAQARTGRDAPTGVSTERQVQLPERFPAPAPPSEQERLLARMAQDRTAAQAVAASTAKTSENIVISRVTIDPVEIPLLPGPNQGE